MGRVVIEIDGKATITIDGISEEDVQYTGLYGTQEIGFQQPEPDEEE